MSASLPVSSYNAHQKEWWRRLIPRYRKATWSSWHHRFRKAPFSTTSFPGSLILLSSVRWETLGTTLNSHSAFLHPGVFLGTGEFLGKPNKLRGSDLRWTSFPSRGSTNTSSRLMLQKPVKAPAGLAPRIHFFMMTINKKSERNEWASTSVGLLLATALSLSKILR